MAMFIADADVEEQLITDRQARGLDQHDEVWEGVYFMAPIANDEHQGIATELSAILMMAVQWAGLGKVRSGVNLVGKAADWRQDYRCPDVIVFLNDTKARNFDSHWRGAADFLVEVVSPGDRTLEKLPFYEKLGVRELLVIDRAPWSLELYRLVDTKLECAARVTPGDGTPAASAVVPLSFQLVAAEPRPKIVVTHHDGRQRWEI